MAEQTRSGRATDVSDTRTAFDPHETNPKEQKAQVNIEEVA